MKFIRTGIWILVFASFAVVVSSCAKEYTEDSPLLLPEVEEVLSSTYFANDKAVFTNESLDTMSFFISADKRVSPQELPDGDEVYMENHFVSLGSDSDEQIDLIIFGGAFINADLSMIKPSIYLNFMPYNTAIGNLLWI